MPSPKMTDSDGAGPEDGAVLGGVQEDAAGREGHDRRR